MPFLLLFDSGDMGDFMIDLSGTVPGDGNGVTVSDVGVKSTVPHRRPMPDAVPEAAVSSSLVVSVAVALGSNSFRPSPPDSQSSSSSSMNLTSWRHSMTGLVRLPDPSFHCESTEYVWKSSVRGLWSSSSLKFSPRCEAARSQSTASSPPDARLASNCPALPTAESQSNDNTAYTFIYFIYFIYLV